MVPVIPASSLFYLANWVNPVPDWTAFLITLVLTTVLSVGVQESTRFNNLFTLLNLGVVSLVIGLGLFESSLANWSLDVSAAGGGGEERRGTGGFFPFGLSGTLSGAATCFYRFVGFDAIATTGEETRNPQRSIPIAIGKKNCQRARVLYPHLFEVLDPDPDPGV
jgi:amino acid transporter